jgi:RNA polymerase sigma-70 factor (ECF subfamily)
LDADEFLVERLKRRDEAAFNVLVTRHQGRVYRLLLRLLGDPAEAEDVAQEVFVTVFKAIDGFRGDSQLSTWLFRITVNHGKNRLKYHARRARDAQRELTETTTGGDGLLPTGSVPERPDQKAEALQAQDLLRQALAMLEDEQRELVVLRDIENLSYEEIQQQTGLPSGTVKSRLHRARLALTEHYRALSEGETP